MHPMLTFALLCVLGAIYLIFFEVEHFEQYAIIEKKSYRLSTFPNESERPSGPFNGSAEESVGKWDTYRGEEWNVHLLCESGDRVVWQTDRKTWHYLLEKEKIRVYCLRGRIFRGLYVEREVS